jgi:hypothetical protein
MRTPEDDLGSTARPDAGQPVELSTARLLDVPPETAQKIDEQSPRKKRLLGFFSWMWPSD